MSRKKTKRKNHQILDDLQINDKSAVYSRAAKLRKAAKKDKSSSKSSFKQKLRQGLLDEDSPGFEKLYSKQENSLESWAIKAVAKSGEMDAGKSKDRQNSDLKEGIIAKLSTMGGTLFSDNLSREFQLRPDMAAVQKTDLAVGDKVLFSNHEDGWNFVEHVLPRTQIFSRPDPTRKSIERVIAVNMDIVMIIAAAAPKLNVKLIDRFLIAVRQTNAQPLICINKMDLLNEGSSELNEQLAPYRDLKIPIFVKPYTVLNFLIAGDFIPYVIQCRRRLIGKVDDGIFIRTAGSLILITVILSQGHTVVVFTTSLSTPTDRCGRNQIESGVGIQRGAQCIQFVG